MSIDVNWETLTGGPDGVALAETVRNFIHDKFQQVTLPRFIRSVKVHSFDFGSVAPDITLKDICDPLSDFYEEDESGSSEDEDRVRETVETKLAAEGSAQPLRDRRNRAAEERLLNMRRDEGTAPFPIAPRPLRPFAETRVPGLRTGLALGEHLGSPLLSRAPTPGIPGGTSNLSYFHLPLGAGLSGTTTPLAAVAGAQFQTGWQDHSHHGRHALASHQNATSVSSLTPPSSADPSSRPPSQHQHDSTRRSSQADLEDSPWEEAHDSTPSVSPLPRMRERSVEDIQVVSHVKYSGDIKMSLTAEILLDYPMPSFVGIPLKLNITGLTFDGVAILAYIKKRAHFCFLSPEDADAVVGGDADGDEHSSSQSHNGEQQSGRRPRLGGLLEHIKVESEIGQKENGKQVLKNVGKVEKFVLEQVRRIFEDEFVYPSFWTFLV